MFKLDGLTKVCSRNTNNEINYIRPKDILKELHILEKQKGWAIFEALEILKKGKADSFSFTKDYPYQYFYARINEDTIILKLRTKKRETEFRIPHKQLVF